MNGFFTTRRLCRAGIIAALYVALTYAFGALSHQGVLQIRPAEALCVLPLFFPEAIPALFVGCAIGNILSPFALYDVLVGATATLIAAFGTWGVGKLIKNHPSRVSVGGLFPLLVNAFLIPVVIVLMTADVTSTESAVVYWTNFGWILATEAIWVYALGTPLYSLVYKFRKRNISAFCD